MSDIIKNKLTVTRALKELFVDKDMSAIERYWGDTYIQHDPDASDGLEGLRWFAQNIKSFETYRIICEGDFVLTHNRASGLTPKPMIVFHIYFLKNGRIVEHWDTMQEEAEKTASGRTQLDGPTEVENEMLTAQNKKLIKEFAQNILLDENYNQLAAYISHEKYYQHNPIVEDGLEGFAHAMEKMNKQGMGMRYKKVHRILAEGEFVFTHSEGEFGGKHMAFADLFRIENGKITEHWDCIQEVPEQTKSGHTMFEKIMI